MPQWLWPDTKSAKGDSPGHPFRGNQFTSGSSGGGTEAGQSESRDHMINAVNAIDKNDVASATRHTENAVRSRSLFSSTRDTAQAALDHLHQAGDALTYGGASRFRTAQQHMSAARSLLNEGASSEGR